MCAMPVFNRRAIASPRSSLRVMMPADNPYSESQFKTLTYRPHFPARFESQQHARDCVRDLIDGYNNEHHHSSLAMLTPHDVHHGLAEQRLAERAIVLEAAYRAHPERFVRGAPRRPGLPRAVWINPPTTASEEPARDLSDTGCTTYAVAALA